jgi:hypothetical protein
MSVLPANLRYSPVDYYLNFDFALCVCVICDEVCLFWWVSS